MKTYKTGILLGIIFLSLSIVLYTVHIYYFYDFNPMISELTAQLAI
jgi:hypothetical protein